MASAAPIRRQLRPLSRLHIIGLQLLGCSFHFSLAITPLSRTLLGESSMPKPSLKSARPFPPFRCLTGKIVIFFVDQPQQAKQKTPVELVINHIFTCLLLFLFNVASPQSLIANLGLIVLPPQLDRRSWIFTTRPHIVFPPSSSLKAKRREIVPFVSRRANACTDARPLVTAPLITPPSTLTTLAFPRWEERETRPILGRRRRSWRCCRLHYDPLTVLTARVRVGLILRGCKAGGVPALSCVPCLLLPVSADHDPSVDTFTDCIVKIFLLKNTLYILNYYEIIHNLSVVSANRSIKRKSIYPQNES